MVWAGISYGYRTQLVVIDDNLNAQKYRDRVLAPHVVPHLQNHGVISVFQQDNARPQVAHDNIQFLRNNNIDFIDDHRANFGIILTHVYGNVKIRLVTSMNSVTLC